jgi:hypothetical protein
LICDFIPNGSLAIALHGKFYFIDTILSLFDLMVDFFSSPWLLKKHYLQGIIMIIVRLRILMRRRTKKWFSSLPIRSIWFVIFYQP